MPKTLDTFEYASDAAARSAYPSTETEKKAHYLDTGCNGSHTIGDAGGLDYWYCVRVVLSKTWRPTGASFYIQTKTGNPGGPFYIRLETSVSNQPSGTLVHANASGSIASPVVGAWNRVNFTPFSLAAGTYYLMCYIPDQPNNNSWNICRVDPSPGRRGWSTNHGSSWNMYDNSYIPYHRVYGEVLQCFSNSSIEQQGSYCLQAIAEATDSLNDYFERTVTPTVNLSGMQQIKYYIRASRTGSNIKIGIKDSGGVWTEQTPSIAVANTWYEKTIDISGVSDANKDAINRIRITVVDASVDNTFYLDYMRALSHVWTFTEDLGILESLPNLARALTITESLALLEDLTQYARGLPLEESLALKEEETADISSLLTESLGLLESLPTLGRALTLQESLALLEALTEEDRGLTLEESLALLESLPLLSRALTLDESLALREAITEWGFTLEESLALSEALTQEERALTLQEAVALLESLPTLERGLSLTESLGLLESETAGISCLLTENLALKEDLTQLGRTLTLEEALALLEEVHAYSLLCEIDKLGNIKLSGLVGSGNVYAYVDSDGKIHRGAAYP